MEFAFAVELQAFAASATFIGVFKFVPLTQAAVPEEFPEPPVFESPVFEPGVP